jgi:TonB family protein
VPPARGILPPENPIRLPDSPPLVAEATGTAAAPTPEQLLRGLAAGRSEPAAAAGADRAAATGVGPESGTNAEPTGYMQATALEWKAGERSLLQQPRLGFPKLLLEKGLEVDVEAAFVVAPSGQVVRVEITRSSGFASVDREVEQAMLDALFAESSREDSGRIQFRFRLERKQ